VKPERCSFSHFVRAEGDHASCTSGRAISDRVRRMRPRDPRRPSKAYVSVTQPYRDPTLSEAIVVGVIGWEHFQTVRT
jgi:hypothetical protein